MTEWKLRVQKLRRFEVESTSKYRRRIDVIISTWIRLSKSPFNFHELSTWNFDLESMTNRRRCVHWVVVAGFHFFYSKQSFFSSNFNIMEPFNLDYVIRFYKPKKELLLSKYQWQKYLVATRKIIKVLHGNLPRVNGCATMPSVNNFTKSAQIN